MMEYAFEKGIRATRREKLRHLWKISQWYLISLLWLIAFLLGYFGFQRYYSLTGQVYSFWDTVYVTCQLYFFRASVLGPVNWMLGTARLLAPAVMFLATTKVFLSIFKEQIMKAKIHLYRGHIVICGLGRKGKIVTEQLLSNEDIGREYTQGNAQGEGVSRKNRPKRPRVVIIEQNRGNPYIDDCRDRGAQILFGDVTEPGILRSARVHKADYLISVCGDDGINAKVALYVRDLMGGGKGGRANDDYLKIKKARRGRALNCFVHIADYELFKMISEQVFLSGHLDLLRLSFFNIYDSGARMVLEEHPPYEITADGSIAEHRGILVVGLEGLGESLLRNMAWDWHNLQEKHPKEEVPKLKITILDKHAQDKLDLLQAQYPQLKSACTLTSRNTDISSADFYNAGFLDEDFSRIYVCMEDDSQALSAALSLHRSLEKRSSGIPVIAYMTYPQRLAALLSNDSEDFSGMYVVGLLGGTWRFRTLLFSIYEWLARELHKSYRSTYKGLVKDKDGELKPNPADVDWRELPEVFRESSRQAAADIVRKMRDRGYGIIPLDDWNTELVVFSEDEVEILAEMEHERWMRERIAGGWRYGPEKDERKLENPYIVPWDDGARLPDNIKEYDRVFSRSIPALLKNIGYQVTAPGPR